MKASELRIGNLVDLGNRIAKISEIYHKACTVLDLEETQDTIEDYERTKPIPLTEEWLLKFGFTLYNKENPIMFKGVVFIEQRQKTLIGTQFFTFHFDGNTIKIQYVHQLQNLYFVLTNEELNLKSE